MSSSKQRRGKKASNSGKRKVLTSGAGELAGFGGLYVIPKSGCTQNGHLESKEISGDSRERGWVIVSK